jgi:peptidoglycan/xylan/chitin deacetylase (PgdA/CDA1 family)
MHAINLPGILSSRTTTGLRILATKRKVAMLRPHRLCLVCLLLLESIALAGCTAPVVTLGLRVPILMYHYISVNPHAPNDPLRTSLSVPPAQFAQQLAYLHQAHYTTITLDDLVDALHRRTILPPKPVILTFDDGYVDFFTNAYPLLQYYHDKATIYIITHKVGTAGYLSWGELHILAASPLITIAAHTRTHPDLPLLSAQQSWAELAGSKTDLETHLGITVRHLAYPAGHYTTTTLLQAAEIGFVTAVTTEPGMDARLDRLLTLPRVRVHGGAPLTDLIAGLEDRRSQATPTVATRGVIHQPARRQRGEAGGVPRRASCGYC